MGKLPDKTILKDNKPKPVMGFRLIFLLKKYSILPIFFNKKPPKRLDFEKKRSLRLIYIFSSSIIIKP